jgi:hypothetical protein
VDSATIRDLLAACLARRGLDPSASRIPIAGDPAVAQRIWEAFRELAALPVDGLHPGLHVPGPAREDTDRLSLETRLETRPAGRNLPERPPAAWLVRQLYLVDADEEFQDFDVASLRLVLDMDLHGAPGAAGATIFGGGGPERASDWIAEVERSPLWRQIVGRGQLAYAVLE